MYLKAEGTETAKNQKDKNMKYASPRKCKELFMWAFLWGINWFYEVWELWKKLLSPI